jgi:hypothetical protein
MPLQLTHAAFSCMGESVYHGLSSLESIALEISSLLAAEDAAVEREKVEINFSVLTLFGRHCGALRISEGRFTKLHRISHL